MCSRGMENYMMYNGTRGVYTHTMKHERDENCIVCSAGVPLRAPAGATLQARVRWLRSGVRGWTLGSIDEMHGGPLTLTCHLLRLLTADLLTGCLRLECWGPAVAKT